jgi:hypothetical protein
MDFERKRSDEQMDIIKQGVLEGVIQILETHTGFTVDTPRVKVNEYVWQHPKFKSKLSMSSAIDSAELTRHHCRQLFGITYV